MDKTKKAMEQLEQALYIAQPEVIMVITPHGEVIPDAVSINLNDRYVAEFSEFGDLVTRHEWKSELMLVNHIREDFKAKSLPLVLTSAEHLDYGTAVPLSYLTAHLPNVRVIPLVTSHLDSKTHFTVGKELRDEISRSTRRIAVIASADLSHRAGERSPAGLSPQGVSYDEKVNEILASNRTVGILDIDETWSKEAEACGTKVLATFCGIMDDVRHETTIAAYEKPFGVGYLTAEMRIA